MPNTWYDPLSGGFDGFFRASVAIFVMGDSVGRQLEGALRGAVATNPHLRGVRFGNVSTKLATREASRSALESLMLHNKLHKRA